MITTTEDLKALVSRARKTDAVALDTEFVWERTYYPQLGLIQIALSDEDCELIDPIAIEDLSPLGELLSDRGVVKILHDAPQDLAILYQATGAAPQNIFDTRLAAGFSDLPATLSLCNLIKELLEIELPKTETRTNWLRRPLNDKQVEYALDDVRYLRAVRVLLLSRIIGPKIKSWLQEELNLLNNPQTYIDNGNGERFRKIRGAGSLSRQSLAILSELAQWREAEAKKQDKPRGHIIKDNILIAIAKKKTLNAEELSAKTGLSPKAQKRYGSKIVSLTLGTLESEEDSYPPLERSTRLSNRDKETLERLQNLIELKSDLLGIDPILVGNMSELKSLAKLLSNSKATPLKQLRQTTGWRKSFLEEFFHHNR
ncbi:ribonuclease D [Desulfosediminicola flagellatus]|uniref:ribonuclease D n=1 Tax=Desulfosediminicola flagellatus TaxID=2569541 RepID=UPI0010ACAB2C|nr:HRDC domain-containing protein [Desulfosediminicola flagellatus]